MSIRKYGNEPAQVETRDQDNDQETLRNVSGQTQEDAGGDHTEPEREDREGVTSGQ